MIAEALSKLATDKVTPIRRPTTTRKRNEGTAQTDGTAWSANSERALDPPRSHQEETRYTLAPTSVRRPAR